MRAASSSGSSDSRGGADAALDPPDFERQVRDALAHLHDPGHLQSHPLTRYLKAETAPRPSSLGLGRALRQCLLDAVESVRPSAELPADRHASRAYQILRLRYIEALEVSQVLDRLSLSQSLYYLELQRAIKGLSAVLRERWCRRTCACA